MASSKVAATKKIGEALDVSFIMLATPKENAFSDGATVRVVQECSLTEVLSILRALKSGKKNATVDKFKLDEAGSILVIKGSVQPMSNDLRTIKLDGVEYPLTDAKTEFVSEFVEIN